MELTLEMYSFVELVEMYYLLVIEVTGAELIWLQVKGAETPFHLVFNASRCKEYVRICIKISM